jgi:CRP-like cAMP-binding protein
MGFSVVTAQPRELGRASALSSAMDAIDLTRIEILRNLSSTELALVRKHLKIREVRAGEILNSDGEATNPVRFVLSGSYRLTIMTPSGAHVAIRTIEPGGHTGEVTAFANAELRYYNLFADVGGLILEMPAQAFVECVLKIPPLCKSTLAALAVAAAARAERIFQLATLDVRQRLLAELFRLALSGRRIDDQITINPAPTQDAIAMQIGATREVVARHLKSLVQQGLVLVRRREITILDFDRLGSSVERDCGLRPHFGGDQHSRSNLPSG